MAAGRSYPTSEVRGDQEETPCVRGQGGSREELPRIRGQWHLRSGAVTLRSHPTPEARAHSGEEQPKEQWLCRRRRA